MGYTTNLNWLAAGFLHHQQSLNVPTHPHPHVVFPGLISGFTWATSQPQIYRGETNHFKPKEARTWWTNWKMILWRYGWNYSKLYRCLTKDLSHNHVISRNEVLVALGGWNFRRHMSFLFMPLGNYTQLVGLINLTKNTLLASKKKLLLASCSAMKLKKINRSHVLPCSVEKNHHNQATTRWASKQALKKSYDAVGGFQPSWKDISQIGKRIKTCLETPPTPLKTNMTFGKSSIFLRKHIFKCWSFQCQKSKIPHAKSDTPRCHWTPQT